MKKRTYAKIGVEGGETGCEHPYETIKSIRHSLKSIILLKKGSFEFKLLKEYEYEFKQMKNDNKKRMMKHVPKKCTGNVQIPYDCNCKCNKFCDNQKKKPNLEYLENREARK